MRLLRHFAVLKLAQKLVLRAVIGIQLNRLVERVLSLVPVVYLPRKRGLSLEKLRS
jgi:hypothetical protein